MRRLARLLAPLLLAQAAAAGPAVRDDTGRTVQLDAPARRIVTLAPHATELAYAAGAGAQVVATVEHSDEPPAARALPRVGGLAGIDREQVLGARPDLVVAWESGNPPGLLAWLERRGIAVYRTEPRRLADVDRAVADLATLAGRAPPPSRPPPAPAPAAVRALFLFWDRPPIVAAEDHVLADLLRACGAEPALPGLRGKAATVSPEALLAARADVLFTTDGRVLARDDASRTGYRELPVAETERTALAAAQRPGPRLATARAAVCRHVAALAPGATGTATGHTTPVTMPAAPPDPRRP